VSEVSRPCSADGEATAQVSPSFLRLRARPTEGPDGLPSVSQDIRDGPAGFETSQGIDLSTYSRTTLDISCLVLGIHVRSGRVNEDHVAALTDAVGPLPPIVVHASTMTVIDGVHRLHAARAQGQDQIEAIMVDCDAASAYLLAVCLNGRHGLPLSRADRRAAVGRILRLCWDWSDRRIAAVAGVSPKTVGAVRRCSTEELPQSNIRRGADGRERPLDTTDGRRRALEILTDQPNASLRQVAEAVGMALSTVQDVRRRTRPRSEAAPGGPRPAAPAPREEPPSPHPAAVPLTVASSPGVLPEQPVTDNSWDPPPQSGTGEQRAAAPPGTYPLDLPQVLKILVGDPSVRCSDAGRTIHRLLSVHTLGVTGFERLAHAVPAHRRGTFAHLARQCADNWLRFASEIEKTEDVRHLTRGAPRRP